jgi:peptide/nickel transport system substrate-binding protein
MTLHREHQPNSRGIRRVSRRRVLQTGLGGAGAAAVFALGCRDDGQGRVGGAASATSRVPQRGGTLRVVWTPGEGPRNLDPHMVSHAAVASGTGGIALAYSRLVRLKTDPEVPTTVNPEVIGDTAEAWEQPDDTTYLFTLRRGVKYHNVPPVNGREWTAEDLVYSWNRQRDKTVLASQLAEIRWTAVDKYTVKVETNAPDADFLLKIRGNKVDIAREAVEAKGGDLKDGPVIGTGPWMFGEWRYNEVVRMTRHADYFLAGLPYLDEVVVYRIADPGTAVAAMRTKQVLTYAGAPSDIKQLTATSGDIRAGQMPTGGVWLNLNGDRAPMNDVRVRQAVSKAIDRQAIYDTLGGLWGWGGMLTFLPPRAALPKAEYQDLLAYDPKEARALLEAAGVTNWKPEMLVFVTTGTVDAAEVMSQQLRAVGIELTITTIDGNRYISLITEGANAKYDMFLQTMSVASPNADLLSYVRSGGPRNVLKLRDAKLDGMIDRQARMVGAPDERVRLLQDIQRRMIELAAPVLLAQRVEHYAWWSELQDYSYMSPSVGEHMGWVYTWLAS